MVAQKVPFLAARVRFYAYIAVLLKSLEIQISAYTLREICIQ